MVITMNNKEDVLCRVKIRGVEINTELNDRGILIVSRLEIWGVIDDRCAFADARNAFDAHLKCPNIHQRRLIRGTRPRTDRDDEPPSGALVIKGSRGWFLRFENRVALNEFLERTGG